MRAHHHFLKRVLEQFGLRAPSILVEWRRRGTISKEQLERARVDGFFGREVDGRGVVVVPDMLFHGRLRVISVPREFHIGVTLRVRHAGPVSSVALSHSVSQERLSHPDGRALRDALAKLETACREHHDRRPVVKVAHLVAFPERRVAGDAIGASISEIQSHVQEVEADAGDKNCRHRHHRQRLRAVVEARLDDDPLVPTVEPLDFAQCNRIDIPCVARNIGDAADATVRWRVEAVIHARRQTQRDISSITVSFDQTAIAQQVFQPVRKTFRLKHRCAVDQPMCSDDGVAGAHEHVGCRVNRAGFRSKLSDKAVVHARKFGLPRFVQSKIGEAFPQCKRHVPDEWLFDSAEPAEEPRRQPTRNAVREKKAKFVAYRASIK